MPAAPPCLTQGTRTRIRGEGCFRAVCPRRRATECSRCPLNPHSRQRETDTDELRSSLPPEGCVWINNPLEWRLVLISLPSSWPPGLHRRSPVPISRSRSPSVRPVLDLRPVMSNFAAASPKVFAAHFLPGWRLFPGDVGSIPWLAGIDYFIPHRWIGPEYLTYLP